ncbi:MAG: flagellar protein FlaG [Deltaproteobacteria bacterium]|nr:flagellar protein FlaG [Deltaproteobacteria bacterium]
MAIAVVNMSGMPPAYAEKTQPAVRERATKDPAPQDEAKPEVKDAPKAPEINVNGTKAVFAVDDNKNVIIRIFDSDGKLLRQIPPEEYLATAMRLRDAAKTLFDMEV